MQSKQQQNTGTREEAMTTLLAAKDRVCMHALFTYTSVVTCRHKTCLFAYKSLGILQHKIFHL